MDEQEMIALHSSLLQIGELKQINEMIRRDPSLIPSVLHLCSEYLEDFREQAKKQNDALLREALGDAVHIIGLKRKPSPKMLFRHCIRIVRAIFPKGTTKYHHEGEKDFYNRCIKPYLPE